MYTLTIDEVDVVGTATVMVVFANKLSDFDLVIRRDENRLRALLLMDDDDDFLSCGCGCCGILAHTLSCIFSWVLPRRNSIA